MHLARKNTISQYDHTNVTLPILEHHNIIKTNFLKTQELVNVISFLVHIIQPLFGGGAWNL